jgi:hypothetical protein
MTMAEENRGRVSPAKEPARIALHEKGKPPQPLIDIDFVHEVGAGIRPAVGRAHGAGRAAQRTRAGAHARARQSARRARGSHLLRVAEGRARQTVTREVLS